MYSVRLEPTELILIGTRTTYQATGGVGAVALLCDHIIICISLGLENRHGHWWWCWICRVERGVVWRKHT